MDISHNYGDSITSPGIADFSHAVSNDCASHIQFNGVGNVIPKMTMIRVMLFFIKARQMV